MWDTVGACTLAADALLLHVTKRPLSPSPPTTAVDNDKSRSGVLVDVNVYTHVCRGAIPAVTVTEQRLQIAVADIAWREIGDHEQAC